MRDVIDTSLCQSTLRPPSGDWRDEIAIHEAQFALCRAAPFLTEAARQTDPWLASSAARDTETANPAYQPTEGKPSQNPIATAMILAGTAALLCGGVLAGWSFLTAKPHLWSLGLPILLAGQAAMLVGVVIGLERAWRADRATSAVPATIPARTSEAR